MGLTLTRAPSFSAALPHAREAWRGRGGLLVVPRREAATDALLDAAGAGALLGLEAVTFGGLRGRVAQAAGTPEPARPARIEVRIALREVLKEVDLAPFGESEHAPGFLGAVERALGELRGAGVTADRARAAAATPRGRALAEIHGAALGRVPHPADAAWDAVGLAARVRRFPPVTVSGFDDLDPAGWALLRALGEATEVEAVVPYEPGRAAFEARHGRWARWAGQARAAAVDGGGASGPALLARRLFEEGPPIGPVPGLRLVAATGTRGMLRAAVEEVLAAEAAGVAPARAALVVPRLAELRDDLDRLLEDWGVPARRATQVRVLEAPLALALTHLLHLGELAPDDPGALHHLLGWLRTPYSGADPGEVDRFGARALRGRLAGRGELIRRWGDRVIAPARRLVAAASRGPRAQLAALVELGWAALRRAGAAAGPPSRADLRDRAALGALAGLAHAVGGADEEPAADDPAPRARGPLPPGALGELVADLTFTERDGPAEGLDLHDLASLRGRRYDLVVVAGLDGDGVPGRPAAEPLLEPLRSALADVLPPRAPGTSESRLRFVHAVDAARERLSLVRRAADDEGREVAPSPYWVEVCRLAGRDIGAPDRTTGSRGEVADAPEDAPTEREALRAMALAGQVAPGPLAAAAARRVRPLGVPAGAFRERARLRVTELEAYLSCPYGWFRDSWLAPQELDQGLDSRAEGELAHEVLQAVYRDMLSARTGACTAATLPAYLKALGAALARVGAARRPPGAGAVYEALLERLRRHLAAMLRREAARGAGMVPRLLETRLEDRAILAGAAPGTALSGKVDRVDVGAGGAEALVIDYKRSGGDFRAGSDDVAQRLQLPLYAEMARAALDGAEPVGGLYVGILAPGVAGAVVAGSAADAGLPGRCVVSRQRWRELTDEAIEAAREAARGIHAGELTAPAPARCSRWCRCGDLWR